jgi:ribose-phosphate pyrophosphokinase
MKVLSLVPNKAGDIPCKISNFPDGQQDVTIHDHFMIQSVITDRTPVKIVSRLNSFSHLELIICATKALRGLGIKEIHLYVPYLLGARSDRRFVKGGTSYLRDVLAPVINSLQFESVSVLDPHSDVAEACINNFVPISNKYFVKEALVKINNRTQDGIVFVSPDAGAMKKIYSVVDHVHFNGEVLVCSKVRGLDGKILRTEVPLTSLEEKTYIIIDDICDGGRTFINIAEAIFKAHDGLPWKSKIYLIVTHGIFSAGFSTLKEHFDGIYCTNSYSEISEEYSNFVKQLNIW